MKITITTAVLSAASTLALVGTAFAQPDIPAVTREFTIFAGDYRGKVVTTPVTYFGGSRQGDATSRLMTVFGGRFQADAWSREPTVGVQTCAFPYDTPTITQQPGNLSLCANNTDPAEFSVTAVSTEAMVYLWQLDDPDAPDGWTPLSDGLIQGLGLTVGAQTPTLAIAVALPPTRNFRFRCVVSTRCGTIFSNAAALSVSVLCTGDFNADGGIDGEDVASFFASWESGDPGSDVNCDGGIDGGDVDIFFAAWEAGGCG